MTLGCGGYGGNITSDNISPRHLLNIKRLAYEIRPAVGSRSARAETAPTVDAPASHARAVEFVAEADVRAAVAAGRKIVIDNRTIITPSARDLGAEHDVFVSTTSARQ